MAIPTFSAFVAEKSGDGVERSVRELSEGDLPDGEVTVKVEWSGVNYKDGLATTPNGRVAAISPLVPGVDLAGEVVTTSSPDITPGERVIVHGYDLGVASRDETSAGSTRPLEKGRWAAAVDPVGGATLAYVLRTLRHDGAVAASGNTGGRDLHTTVFPFILRGVALLGIDSVQLPMDRRRPVWERMASDLRPRGLDDMVAGEIDLHGLPAALDEILRGAVRGRVLVNPWA